ncbi:hypothetical protein BGZ60DRAFT_526026 [Tricladium varicosporioides]|nr:hypothetical protein BGZ60DRAFT_526026 [Hymenoscyphus varicosporioides]
MAPQLNIVIIGAGIAGLSTAISLQNSCHTITVLERHNSCQALGGPVSLSPNATRVLIEYGLRELLEPKQSSLNKFAFRRYTNGEILGSMADNEMELIYGYPRWGFSRFKLQEMLVKVARERGVSISFGSEVTGVDTYTTSVTLKDGRVLKADLIIGADGIHSITRNTICGNDSKKCGSTLCSYMLNVPRNAILADPDIAEFAQMSSFWLGPGQIVAAINMKDHMNMLHMGFCVQQTEQQGCWHKLGDLDEIRAKFAYFDPKVLKLLSLADLDSSFIWNIHDLPLLSRWTQGHAVIVGDASHAMIPTVGMGASQAIEDSACLTLCLDHAQSVADIPKLLKLYEAIRKPRAEFMITKGRESSEDWNLPDGEKQQARDKFFQSLATITSNQGWDGNVVWEPPIGKYNPDYITYMNAFDVIEYTKRRLSEMTPKVDRDEKTEG